jgi:hypothetical protein
MSQHDSQTETASLGAQRATNANRRAAGEWTTVERAAVFLGFAPVSLRRALDRAARKRADGSIVAQLEGVVGRKLGRAWRVWLDAKWRNPMAAE